MEKLIALVDLSDTVKSGDRFEAPDRILVALGMAAIDTVDPAGTPDDVARPVRRYPRTTRAS
jgi:hypothetical protein